MLPWSELIMLLCRVEHESGKQKNIKIVSHLWTQKPKSREDFEDTNRAFGKDLRANIAPWYESWRLSCWPWPACCYSAIVLPSWTSKPPSRRRKWRENVSVSSQRRRIRCHSITGKRSKLGCLRRRTRLSFGSQLSLKLTSLSKPCISSMPRAIEREESKALEKLKEKIMKV